MASPYEVSTTPSMDETRAGEFELGVRSSRFPSDRVNRYMSMENFFRGQYPGDLYRPVPNAEFDSVSKWSSVQRADGTTERQHGTAHLREAVQDYLGRYAGDFPEPALYRIPISSPDIPPPPNFLPPTLPRE